MSLDSAVLVGCFDDTVWSRVKGRGTFQNSGNLRRFNQAMLKKGYQNFVIDLGECEVMDSTFMGTLAGIALSLRESGQGGLQVVGANSRNSSLLKNLGLDQLFSVKEIGDPSSPPLPVEDALDPEQSPGSAKEVRKDVLEAHEALVQADERNAAKFRDVLEFLSGERTVSDSGS